ncbi:MAG: D-glycero-alpha-D-manno-heptose-1,7-bisphosphate 7-phosphatase, partial [Phycisphaerales bacterium]
GYLLVVVSNQGAVARGRCTWHDVKVCNERMRELLREEAGVEFDGVYFCPFHPKGTVPPYNVEHPTRKPSPGMLIQASRDLGIDLPGSWMVGDAMRDIQAARAAGIPGERAILIGHLENRRFESLREAAGWIVRNSA